MGRLLFWWRAWILPLLSLILASCVKASILTPSNDTAPDPTRLPAFEYKPRVFILSDILNEVDDSESLVRYLLYSNEFQTRGICAVTSEWLQNATYPGAMKEIINAYGNVTDNLNHHVSPEAQYANASTFIDLVTSGPTVYGKKALSQTPSEGALILVERLKESEDPLWVVAWGGVNTLAQALQYIQSSSTEDEAAELRSRLRVYTISDQDDTGPWIRRAFPDVFYIVSIHAWNSYGAAAWAGISIAAAGSNTTVVSDGWIARHIQLGDLGAQYPTPEYAMEGDTPSFLHLIQTGLGDPERPHWGGWGGRYGHLEPGSRQYHDAVDAVVGADGVSYTTSLAGVWRWRAHFQHDFAARIRWTLTGDFAGASHAPVPVVNGTEGPGSLSLNLTVGGAGRPVSVVLDASGTYDPDHPGTTDHLSFQWYQYPEPTEYATDAKSIPRVALTPLAPPAGSNGTLAYNEAGFEDVALGRRVQVALPDGEAGLSYHVVLQVTSEAAALPLTRYLRVILNV